MSKKVSSSNNLPLNELKDNTKIFVFTKNKEECITNSTIIIPVDKKFIQSEFTIEISGDIHKKDVFPSVQKFLIKGEKIMESFIQRIISHQNEFKQKRKALLNSNPNLDMENVKFNFFTKLGNGLAFQFRITIESDKK